MGQWRWLTVYRHFSPPLAQLSALVHAVIWALILVLTSSQETPKVLSEKQNHNLNTHYIRGAMSEKYYGVLYMSCSLIWYK